MVLTAPELGQRQIKPGDEVITVACGFPTTVTPAIQYGAVPVFVDVTVPQYNIDVTQYIEEHNVQTRLLFSGNLIKHPCFDQIRGTDAYCIVGDLSNTDFVMNNTFWAGIYPGMTDETIDYMVKTIIEAVQA